MTAAVLEESLTPENYLGSNLTSLDIPQVSARAALDATRVGTVELMRDGTPVVKVDAQTIGTPLPYREVHEAVAKLDSDHLVVVLGMGMGQLPRALRGVTDVPIIVYEPNAGLLRTALEFGPQHFTDTVLVANSHDLNCTWARYAGQRRQATVVVTPGYSALYPQAHAEISKQVQELIVRVRITKNTYRKRARTWVKDILGNVALMPMSPSVLALSGRMAGIPAFIIGAGPSLDKNVEQLRRAYDKGLVISTNTGAMALAKRNIPPHAIACIESIDISDKLKQLPFLDDCLRIFSLSASPETLRTGQGPLLTFHEGIPQYSQPLEELSGVPGVGICGSVSTAAFSIARALGCSPIVLVGQDLAFTGARTYATGTGYESSHAETDNSTNVVRLHWNQELQDAHGQQHGQRHRAEPLVEAPAWGGHGTVSSGASFAAITTWLGDHATLLQTMGSELRLIDASEGGVHIPGFEDKTLSEVLDSLPDHHIDLNELAQEAAERSTIKDRQQVAQWARQQLAAVKQTRTAAAQLKEASDVASSAIASQDPTLVSNTFLALNQAETELRQRVAAAPLIDAWSHAAVEQHLVGPRKVHDGQQKGALDSTALGAAIATSIERAAEELEQQLADLVNELTAQASTTKGTSLCR